MNKKAKVYAIELAFAVAVTALTVAVQRAVSSPDFGRTLGMKVSLGVKRFAQKQEDMWRNVAGSAANTYNGFKP